MYTLTYIFPAENSYQIAQTSTQNFVKNASNNIIHKAFVHIDRNLSTVLPSFLWIILWENWKNFPPALVTRNGKFFRPGHLSKYWKNARAIYHIFPAPIFYRFTIFFRGRCSSLFLPLLP